MPIFQVTCKEIAYITRTYELEADNAQSAFDKITEDCGGENIVDEQINEGYEFCRSEYVCDEDGNQVGVTH